MSKEYYCLVPGSLLSKSDHINNGWFEPHYSDDKWETIDEHFAMELYPERFGVCQYCCDSLYLGDTNDIQLVNDSFEDVSYCYFPNDPNTYYHMECFLSNLKPIELEHYYDEVNEVYYTFKKVNKSKKDKYSKYEIIELEKLKGGD